MVGEVATRRLAGDEDLVEVNEKRFESGSGPVDGGDRIVDGGKRVSGARR